jgi:hypothetical protein
VSTPDEDVTFGNQVPDFDSHDTEIVVVNGPGDNSIRPSRPQIRQLLLAERERIARWHEHLKRPPTGRPPEELPGMNRADE